MPYGYRRRSYRRSFGRSMTQGGTVYQKGGANFEVRRHSFERTIEVAPQKSKIVPLLATFDRGDIPTGVSIDADTKIAAEGSEVFITGAVQAGSLVKNLHLDLTVTPKTLDSSAMIDWYVGRGMFSFHDLLAKQVYGVDVDSDNKLQYSDETGSPTKTDMMSATGVFNDPPELNLTKRVYDYGDVIKHWWSRPRKNILAAGVPLIYNRWERVPRKCKRANPRMLYALMLFNDAAPVSGSEADTLRFEIKEQFTEIPLVQ